VLRGANPFTCSMYGYFGDNEIWNDRTYHVTRATGCRVWTGLVGPHSGGEERCFSGLVATVAAFSLQDHAHLMGVSPVPLSCLWQQERVLCLAGSESSLASATAANGLRPALPPLLQPNALLPCIAKNSSPTSSL
jgi:hypothetical protein